MAYRQLLTHKCDVYKLNTVNASTRFGVSIDNTALEYSNTPDLVDVPCYVSKSGRVASISQADPNTIIREFILIHFPFSTNISVNDKVVFEGITYKLNVPRTIRNHHIEVEAYRNDSL